ncbi:hypothetical protein D3C75_1246370 [compost metagenome]
MHPELQRPEDALIDPADQLEHRFLDIPLQDRDFRRPSPVAESDPFLLGLQELIANIDDGIIEQLAVSAESFEQLIIARIGLYKN